MREKQIEHALVMAVKAAGGMCPKLVSPGTDGMPDRMILAPGKKPRPLQERRHKQMRELGFKVFILDGRKQIPEILEEVEHGTRD